MKYFKKIISTLLSFCVLLSNIWIVGIAQNAETSFNVGKALPAIPAITNYNMSTNVKSIKKAPVSLKANNNNNTDNLYYETDISLEDQLNQIFKISTKVYAKGDVTTEDIIEPVDFAVLIDQSQSMSNGSRQADMKTGLKKFLDTIRNSYSEKSDHRVSFTTFRAVAQTYDFNKEGQSYLVAYERNPSSNVWKPANDPNLYSNAIDKLPNKAGMAVYIGGSTDTGEGLIRTSELLFGSKYNTNYVHDINQNRKKVVILITDGIPTVAGFPNNTTKNNAISAAYSLKSSGATIYSLCLGDAKEKGTDEFNINAYCSSDYPNAQSLSNLGNRANAKDYLYTFSVDNQYDMSAVLETIGQNVGTTSIGLNAESIIKSYITSYFNLYCSADYPVKADIMQANPDNPFANTYSSLILSSDSHSQTLSSGLKLTINDTKSIIACTGFDYVKEFVSPTLKEGYTGATNDYGKSLILSFYVKPKDSFMGGNGIPVIMQGYSGIYSDSSSSTPFKATTLQTVNIPIKANLATMNNESWHGENTLENKNFTDFAAITAPTSETYNLTNKGLNNINNAFVKIEENYYDGETLVAKHTVLPYNEDEYEFYSAEFMSGNKNTVPATLKEYIEYKALNANENQFVQPIRVVATVSPIYTIDENDPQGTSIVQNSLGDAVSEQTANATYTITYNFCTLTIGQNEYDYVNGKFRDKSNNFYDIYYNNEYYMSVLGGTTIYEMPVGNYKVVLHTSDTRYNKIEQWEVASTATSEGIASSDNSVSFELSRKYYENHLTVTPDASYYTRQSQYLDNHNTLVRNAASSTRSINGSYSVVS